MAEVNSTLTQNLRDVFAEAQEPGWDGYSASPVPAEALKHALEFVQTIPEDLPKPDPGISPSGYMTLEWYSNPRKIVSVSIGPDDELHFSSLIGRSSAYGSTPLSIVFPPTLRNLIEQVAAP